MAAEGEIRRALSPVKCSAMSLVSGRYDATLRIIFPNNACRLKEEYIKAPTKSWESVSYRLFMTHFFLILFLWRILREFEKICALLRSLGKPLYGTVLV